MSKQLRISAAEIAAVLRMMRAGEGEMEKRIYGMARALVFGPPQTEWKANEPIATYPQFSMLVTARGDERDTLMARALEDLSIDSDFEETSEQICWILRKFV